MRKETPNLLSTLTSSTGRGRFATGFASLAFALGTAGPALADDSAGSLPDPGAVLSTLTTSTVAAPTPPDITPTPTTPPPPASTADTVANTASTPSIPSPVSVESVVSTPVSTTPTVAPTAQASPAPPTAPLPTPDPAPTAPAPTQPASPVQAPADAPVSAVSTSTPTAPPSPAPTPSSALPATAPAAPMPQQPQQYQTPNITDTNSSPNTSASSGAQTPKQSESLPPASGNTLVLNWDWNDLVNCSFCNVSISVRVLSPGDDGDFTQTNAVLSTSVAGVIDSVQRTLTQQVLAPIPAVVVPSTPIVPAPSLSALQAIAASFPLAAAQKLEPPAAVASETAAPSDDTADEASAVDAVAPPFPSEVTPPITVDTTPIPRASAPSRLPARGHAAVASVAKERTHSMTPPAFSPLPAVTPAGAAAARPEVEAVAAPTDAGRRIPSRAPPPNRLPRDGPDLVASAAGHGSAPPPGSPASLLALLVFLVPGFAQWLWARAELRPSALRPGRPERPG